ncbi:hypothetical protein [Arthrobacter sp. GMC3]|uniref:hypothetical protein n=1 Tax=Arthrobacter sp. GMC3 TaxID=2058894 RepID=UPI000CE47966|nr:hypothetical protein [Arthrobacter sp. GMC3]
MTEDESMGGFGIAEIQYMLSRFQNKSAGVSAATLQAQYPAENKDMLLAGASSLLARGLLVAEDGETMSPKGLAAAALYALGNSTRWVSIAFTSAGQGAGVVYFLNSEVNLMMQGRGLGGWYASAQQADADLAASWLEMAQLFAHDNESAAIIFTSTDEDGNLSNVALRTGSAGWEAATGTGTEQTIQVPRVFSDSEARSLLTEKLLG